MYDEEMRALRADLARERATGAAYQERFRMASRELAASEKRYLEQVAETARVRQTLDEVLSSRSWRATRPLRWLAGKSVS